MSLSVSESCHSTYAKTIKSYPLTYTRLVNGIEALIFLVIGRTGQQISISTTNLKNIRYLSRKTSLEEPGALAQRLQCRIACEIQYDCQGAQKWPMGSEKGSNLRLLAISSHFR